MENGQESNLEDVYVQTLLEFFVGKVDLALWEFGDFLAPKSQKRNCVAASELGDCKEIGEQEEFL